METTLIDATTEATPTATGETTKTPRSKRTDPHRPGAIIPAHYRPVLWYSLSTTDDGHPVPSWHVNCQLDRRTESVNDEGRKVFINGEHDADGRCCIVGLYHVARVPFTEHGGTGKCSVCGARFVEGQVWVHEPTGEHVHVGHTCADKYELLADWSEEQLAYGRHKAAHAALAIRQRNEEERREFLDAHPGLEEALAVEHHIIQDIAAKFRTYRSLSGKQVALVLKLADEVRNPKPVEARPESQWVGQVAERLVLTLSVVFVKGYDSAYGTSWLHVFTDAVGNRLKWFGSGRLYPGGVAGDGEPLGKGATVTVKATVKAHAMYEGEKETQLTRVAVHVEKPEGEKPKKTRKK